MAIVKIKVKDLPSISKKATGFRKIIHNSDGVNAIMLIPDSDASLITKEATPIPDDEIIKIFKKEYKQPPPTKDDILWDKIDKLSSTTQDKEILFSLFGGKKRTPKITPEEYAIDKLLRFKSEDTLI